MSLESFARDNIARQLPGVIHKGFMEAWLAVRWAEHQENVEETSDENNSWSRSEFFEYHRAYTPPFRADLYFIDAEEHMLYFFEIEDTHPLTKDKLEKIQDWFDSTGSCDGWYCRLIVTDRYGLNPRMIFAYEHTLGPQPVNYDEIKHKFPKQFQPID